MKRQRLRRAMILISFLLFPVTMNYLSPYLVIVGASQGVVTGSLLMFGLLFVGSLVLGRAYCGWLCPAAAIQEYGRGINDKRVTGKVANRIKYFTWVPWVLGIVGAALSAGGFHLIDPLFMTESGVSVSSPVQFVTYYFVLAIFVALSLAVGRRAACHTICWMAPFMVIGSRIRRLGIWPSLHLVADSGRCTGCKQCDKQCLMSLDVSTMVGKSDMRHDECILCGECVDSCPRSAISFVFGRDQRAGVSQQADCPRQIAK